ncbi:MAG: AraC family transcriptional regulator [Xanthomonadales bacterium]|nr:AraC family transcriptional regulator [Xanthomonadales bacterium]
MLAKKPEKFLSETPFLEDFDEPVYTTSEALVITDVLAEQGVDFRAALEGTGISRRALHDPYARISARQRLALYRNARRLSPDSGFGLTVGTRLHISSYGMYGLAMLSCPTLGDMFDFAFKYLKLAGPLLEKVFVRRGPLAYFEARDALHLGDDLPLAIDICFGSTVSILRDNLGASFVPDRVEFSFAPPPHADRYAAAWGCEAQFETSRSRLEFSASLLDSRIRQTSELTLKLCTPVCERLLAEFESHESLAYKVRRWMMLSPDRSPKIEAAARAFNVTSRTFRRKLAAEGTSFRELRCQVREALATEYLKNTDLTTAEIAERIGFSDSANFRSAFKRWRKLTPTEYRAKATAHSVDASDVLISANRA